MYRIERKGDVETIECKKNRIWTDTKKKVE